MIFYIWKCFYPFIIVQKIFDILLALKPCYFVLVLFMKYKFDVMYFSIFVSLCVCMCFSLLICLPLKHYFIQTSFC